MPRVSVLLPTHNRADVLGLAIQSVLDQTETDFELLIVADGCTDGTVPLVTGIADPRIRLFDLPKGPFFGYANRNIALREARGDYVAFAAHDDLLLPDHLSLLADRLDTTGREWAYSRPLWVSTDGVIVPFATNLTSADELQYFLTVGNTIPASCVVYRRTCLDLYGYWPEDVPSAADWRHWIAIINGGCRENITYLATPTCLHFSAGWKRSRHSAVEEVRTWLDIADRAPWWPDVLRSTVPPGLAEQQVIAAAMRAGGAAWLAGLRDAVDLVINRVAWDDLRIVRPRLRSRDLEVEELRACAAAADHSLADARCSIQRLSDRAVTVDAECTRLRHALAAAEATRVEAGSARDAATREVARLEADLQAAHAQLHACHERLSLTLASTSWRITAPLRALKHRMRSGT